MNDETNATGSAVETANAGGAAQAAEPGAPDQGAASSSDADAASGSSGAPEAQLTPMRARRDALFALEAPTDAERYELADLDGRLADEAEMAEAELVQAYRPTATDDELKARREELLLQCREAGDTPIPETLTAEIGELERELTRRVKARAADRALVERAIEALPDLSDADLVDKYEQLQLENDPENTLLLRAIATVLDGRQQLQVDPPVLTQNAADRICTELEGISRALGCDVIPFDQVAQRRYTDVDRVVHRLIDIRLALEALELYVDGSAPVKD